MAKEMKVLDLLEEIEEICATSTGMPLTNKIVVDKPEMLEIVKEIRIILPDEIEQARFVIEERNRILEQAKHEYSLLIKDAENQARILVEQNEITNQARQRAADILGNAEHTAKKLKMDTYDYIDKILANFQEKMDILNAQYLGDMFSNIQMTFEDIEAKLQGNRKEIKELAYRTQVEDDL